MTAPIIYMHHRIAGVRDDLFLGGTKARFIAQVFDGVHEAVYASPPEGGAQTAIATVARRLGKRATIFVAARTRPHPRTLKAARLGAKVVPISPGYLSVVQSRAREYCRNTGASLIPFGAEIPGAVEAIAAAARLAAFEPEENDRLPLGAGFGSGGEVLGEAEAEKAEGSGPEEVTAFWVGH